MQVKERFLELDFFRGLAVAGMIVFHFFYILDYFEILKSSMFSGWWDVLGQFVRFSFLGLVGVGMVVSYNKVLASCSSGFFWRTNIFCWRAVLRQWRRAGVVLVLALVISLATFLVVGDQYVKFGILHLIAVAIFVLSFFVRLPWVVLIFGVAAIFLGNWLAGFTTDSLFLFILGMKSETIFSIDYFPVFPWISVICFGIFFGNLIYSDEDAGRKTNRRMFLILRGFFGRGFFKPFLFLGRHSLMTYMLHVPVIILFLWIFRIWSGGF